MSKPVVKVTRYSVPERAKMFRIPAAEVLRCADILRWSEFDKEIIVRRPKEGAFPVHCRLTDHARLVDIEVLERIIQHAISEFVSIVMTFRAARPPLSNPGCENQSPPRDLAANRRIRKLRKRVWQAAGFILGPQDLQIGHPMVPDFLSVAG